MIRRVRGRLMHREAGEVEILTRGGVSYELMVPVTLLDRLPPVGQQVELHTALIAREDALELYGFGSSRERQLFLRLQNASGVGPRLALALLGALPSGRLVRAIRGKEHPVLQTVSGVGRKTAERIVVELADKLDDLAEREPGTAAVPGSAAAVQALRALGYGHSESEEAVSRALVSLDGRGIDVEELVRLALREL
ncbi:MAG: Holliday junction branch migration protein RuvA [Gemmatimonadota bacterium]